jgi:hypothetical protein
MSLALSPPVTSYSAPVTILAASEARNTAAGEMSSGGNQPTFSGTVGARISQAYCGDGWSSFGRPVSSIVFAQPLVVEGERGVDEARDQGLTVMLYSPSSMAANFVKPRMPSHVSLVELPNPNPHSAFLFPSA